MNNVYVFFAEGFEEIEALAPVDLMKRAGIPVKTVSISENKTVYGSHNLATITDLTLNEVDFGEAAMLVLPGGPGHKKLEACDKLMRELDAFAKEKKPIAAICASPSIFGRRGYLEGKKATAFPGFEGELKGAIVSEEEAVIDGNIITGRGMGCSIPFGLKIVEFFTDCQTARELAKKVVYLHE